MKHHLMVIATEVAKNTTTSISLSGPAAAVTVLGGLAIIGGIGIGAYAVKRYFDQKQF